MQYQSLRRPLSCSFTRLDSTRTKTSRNVDAHPARDKLRRLTLQLLDLEKRLVHGPFIIISPFIIVIAYVARTPS